MPESSDWSKATVIFLGDANPFSKLVLLQRAPNRTFCPNLWTGIGGKHERGESNLGCAVRELEEETDLVCISLTEFGRVIINGDKMLAYFFGVLPYDQLPYCNEGKLHWVPKSQIFDKDHRLIPATASFLSIWQLEYGWRIDRPFTIFLERKDRNDPMSKVTDLAVHSGLHE